MKTEIWNKLEADFKVWVRAKWCPTHEQILEWFKIRLTESEPSTVGQNNLRLSKLINNTPDDCIHFDFLQERNLCCSPKIGDKCIGVECGKFEHKK